MTYPPQWRRNTSTKAATALIREHPVANLLTAHSGLRSSRIPFVLDMSDGRPSRLRGHLNGQNPQCDGLDGQDALVSFSGRTSYISPHWRSDLSRAGTIDYEEVQVRGKIRISNDIEFFKTLINDLAALIEPQYSDVGDYPVWHTSMAPSGYIERLFPAIVAFEIDTSSVHMVSKLHQSFPEEDRRSIADHLSRSKREDAREIAKKIRQSFE